MKSEAYPPLTSLSLSASSRLIYLFLSLSGLVSVFLRERKREKSTFSFSLSLSVEKREDIILLRTRHKVKYRRHKRRTRPWTSLVLRIGTNEEEKKKKENGREETQERRKEARGRGGGTYGILLQERCRRERSTRRETSRSYYAVSTTPARLRNLLSGCQFEPNLETSIASTNPWHSVHSPSSLPVSSPRNRF